METIEVHSKDFVVRWVTISPGSKVTWKVTPTKRSISFGVYERGASTDEPFKDVVQIMSQTSGTIAHKLDAAGCVPVAYNGFVKIESKDSLDGSATVSRGPMIAFVFDNTFSKNYSKFVELTFNVESPKHVNRSASMSSTHGRSEAAAAAAAALRFAPARDDAVFGRESPTLEGQQQFPAIQTGSAEAATSGGPESAASGASLARQTTFDTAVEDLDAPHAVRQRQSTLSSNTGGDSELSYSLDGRYITGFLQKKRRKQFQGFARRYFSLDTRMGLLNYYLNARSRSLRGVMPIRIAELKSDPRTLQLTLDSGMEKWTLKASDPGAFEAWKAELEAVRASGGHESVANDDSDSDQEPEISELDAPLSSVEDVSAASDASYLVTPDAAAALAELKQFISTQKAGSSSQAALQSIYNRLTPSEGDAAGNAASVGYPSRPTASKAPSSATLTPAARLKSLRQLKQLDFKARLKLLTHKAKYGWVAGGIVGTTLGALLGSFVALVIIAFLSAALGALLFLVKNPEILDPETAHAEPAANLRRSASLKAGAPSTGSGTDDEDNDASSDSDFTDSKSISYVPQKPAVSVHSQPQEYATEDPEVAAVFRRLTDEYNERRRESARNTVVIAEEPTESGDTETVSITTEPAAADAADKFPASAETSLYPLPRSKVHRRTSIKGPAQPPPSLMSMLKKAKDPGNMVAPVTANEPLSGTEYVAEIFDNSSMLDAASYAPPASHLRVMLVAVFSVATLSGIRCRERALRKPFTPLLGETFEMVREDRGLRFVAEKVMHKPEVVATQTESQHWTVHFTSRPNSKMWAKSVQITDVGHFSVTFPDGETVSFVNPDLFIRNIIAGERYIDPTGSITVETTAGHKYTATVEFKAKGMFGGRSEEVKLTCGDLVYEGKWAESISNAGKVVWSVPPMVKDPQKHYGWPLFAAQLNEITAIEDGQLPPNDSRLRPDLRHYENQDVDKAEELKLRLEQHQRERRKELEVAGKQHEPFFFVKSNDDKGHYMLREGAKNYWVRRAAQDWAGIPNWFQ